MSWKEIEVEGGYITLDNAHESGVVMMVQDNLDLSTVALSARQAVHLAMALLAAIEDDIAFGGPTK